MESEFESESVHILGAQDRDERTEESLNKVLKAKRNGNTYIELPVISFENQLYGVIGDEPGTDQGGLREATGNGFPPLHSNPPKSSCNSDDRPHPWQRALQIGIPTLVAVTVAIALAVHYGAGRKPINIDRTGDPSLIVQPNGGQGSSEFLVVTRRIQGKVRVAKGKYSHFHSDYQNLKSDGAFGFTSAFISQLDNIFHQSQVAAIYSSSRVLSIRNGSVIVHFQIKFEEDIIVNDTIHAKRPPGGQKQKLESKEATFNDIISTFKTAMTDHNDKASYHMGDFVIDKDSLTLTALDQEIRPVSPFSQPHPTSTSPSSPSAPATSPAPTAACPDNQFHCSSGVLISPQTNCIFSAGVCNGIQDCVDGEDEINCGTKCSDGGFRCRADDATDWKTGSKCTKPGTRCNNVKECSDGSDEEGCPPCTENQFTCTSGHIVCISLKTRCDQEFNCEDKSDEENCTCATNEFRCNNFADFLHHNSSKVSKGCINQSLLCDRVEHCSDNSDEEHCNYFCPDGKFECKTGLISRWPFTGYCLEETERCNGFTECKDGSDEQDCPPKVNNPCYTFQFHCKNGTDVEDRDVCIRKSYVCDRVPDCTDASDEANCTYSCEEDEDLFQCQTGSVSEAPYRGFCIPGHNQCDGKPQCQDSSDEADCPETTCSPGHFECVDGFHITNENKCIPQNYVCDREPDCSDNSDELNCNYTCPEGKEPCLTGILARWPFNGYCIHSREICDGYVDCRDKSDEGNCKNGSCGADFKCVAGRDELGNICIPPEYQCNKVSDCSDNSDEEGCSYSCPLGQLACNSSSLVTGPSYCYNVSERCNGESICQDASDEDLCDVTCSASQFQCVKGVHNVSGERCIGDHYRCDRVPDCTDGSDEEGCTYTCPLGLTACSTGIISTAPHRGFCIPEHGRCNNVTDCEDKSDEKLCNAVCSEGEFLCRNSTSRLSGGRCIIKRFRCDRDKDCSDGSDEENCDYKCPDGKHACKTGKLARFPYYGFCINKRDVCDGFKDCEDNSDEQDCDNSTCSDENFKCQTGDNSTVCKPKSYQCDRVKDCADGSDEENCTYTCPPGKFKCERGTSSRYFNIFGRHFVYTTRTYCIYDHDVCDGTRHCQDGSDERGCEVRCKEDEFLCANTTSILTGSRCIPKRWHCDRDRDCRDGSDEQSCNYRCPTNQLACKSGSLRRWPYVGYCYWQWERCDGRMECSDGSDELECDTHS